MTMERPWGLLGGLSPAQFMRRHWQKKPLLVRQAWPDVQPPLTRSALFALAARDDVESRLVRQRASGGSGQWTLRRGPLARRALPPLSEPGWSLLVQGLDLHVEAAHAMLSRFRFVPDARLDDLMVSYATDAGGVGPHLDSYDVFLLQVQGRRRWRIGRVPQPQWQPGVPLKLLAGFEPEQEWVLEPGDMLYLPPLWGHDGIAEGECMTCSIGFRAPSTRGLARELLQQLADGIDADEAQLYRDPSQPATDTPAAIPPALQRFATEQVERALRERGALEQALGAALTEPKPQVWFDAGSALQDGDAVRLDRRSRMMYDASHVYLNGEAFRAGGRDARLMRRLADQRRLDAADVARLSDDARTLLDDWVEAGWLHANNEAGETT